MGSQPLREIKLRPVVGRATLKFGRWTVLGYSRRRAGRRKGYVRCLCECGTARDVYERSLRAGLSTSCGCLRRAGVYGSDGKKRCPACKALLPLSAFGKRADRGYEEVRPRCKACGSAARRRARNSASAEEKARALGIARAWKRNNRARNRASKRAWEARNAEKVSAYSITSSRKWRTSNRHLAIARSLASRAKKPEQYKAYNLRWARENAARCRAKYKAYMAAKLRAIPSWSDEFDRFVIEEIYDKAQMLIRSTRAEWHVDHVVPLQSRLVCGLHTNTNLLILPGFSNLSKGNRHWPDMWLTSQRAVS